MENDNVHPIFKGLLDSISGEPGFGKIKIGDSVTSNHHGVAKVTGIELMPDKNLKEGGIEMVEIWATLKDYCVFDLSNGHWAYGDQVTLVIPENL